MTPAERTAELTCVTCGAALGGPFCSQCGQKVRPERLTLRGVAEEAAQHVWSLDSGLLRTVVDLVRRPAGLVRDVFAGRTVRYAGPVRYFLIAVTIGQVLTLVVGGMESIAEGIVSARASGAAPARASDVAEAVRRYWVVALAGGVPVVALWSRLLLRRAGLTLAEHLTAWLYLLGQFVLVFGVATTVGEVLSRQTAGPLGYALSYAVLVAGVGLVLWASVGVFGQGRLWSPVAAALSVALGYLFYGTGLAVVLAALG